MLLNQIQSCFKKFQERILQNHVCLLLDHNLSSFLTCSFQTLKTGQCFSQTSLQMLNLVSVNVCSILASLCYCVQWQGWQCSSPPPPNPLSSNKIREPAAALNGRLKQNFRLGILEEVQTYFFLATVLVLCAPVGYNLPLLNLQFIE